MASYVPALQASLTPVISRWHWKVDSISRTTPLMQSLSRLCGERGYRSGKRYAVFQALPHTLEISNKDWRVLSLAHGRRNEAEYEGYVDVDEQLVEDVIRVTELLLTPLT